MDDKAKVNHNQVRNNTYSIFIVTWRLVWVIQAGYISKLCRRPIFTSTYRGVYVSESAFNQENNLLRAFSVITNLRMDLFKALLVTQISWLWPELDKFLSSWWLGLGWSQGCSLFVTCAIMSHSWHLARAFLRGHNKHSQPQIITAGVILTRVHCTLHMQCCRLLE